MTRAYLENTAQALDVILEDKESCLKLIAGGMDRYHALCNKEASVRLRIDHQLEEYYPIMECLDGAIGTE